MSDTTTPLPAGSTAAGPSNAQLLVDLGLGIANVAFPGAGTAIQLGRVAARGIIALYDQIMAAKPPEFSEAQWRALLADEVHDPGYIDKLLNEARARRAAANATP